VEIKQNNLRDNLERAYTQGQLPSAGKDKDNQRRHRRAKKAPRNTFRQSQPVILKFDLHCSSPQIKIALSISKPDERAIQRYAFFASLIFQF
jgi:hypothetical protein